MAALSGLHKEKVMQCVNCGQPTTKQGKYEICSNESCRVKVLSPENCPEERERYLGEQVQLPPDFHLSHSHIR